MFKSVVFAGGGCRCIWQAGFWESAAPALNLKPEIFAGVSLGAAMATLAISETSHVGVNLITSYVAENRKNFYFSNLLKNKMPCPHYKMYRRAFVNSLNTNALNKIKNGPEIRVAITHPPALLGASGGILAGLLIYTIEKNITRPVHPVYGKKLGYTSSVVKLNDCTTPDEIAEIVMCSSCAPPLTPTHRYNGRVAIDGGVYDNVPVHAIGDDQSKGDMLILLTRQYDLKRIPKVNGRVYVQPSVPLPISMWESTDPEGYRKTYDIGRKDGEEFIKLYSKR